MNDTMLPISECVPGHVYRVRARSFQAPYAVYTDASGVEGFEAGFIGIRTKFGSTYLWCEHHWDQGPPWGTASPVEDMGISVPEGTALTTENSDLFRWLQAQVAVLSEKGGVE